MDNTFQNSNLCVISYAIVRKAMKGKPFTMRLAKADGKIVEHVVNKGIDSRLEACFSPDRGDKYVWENGFLNCVVSVESFPVLLRRLSEDVDDAAALLDDCLTVLGFDENGRQFGWWDQ